MMLPSRLPSSTFCSPVAPRSCLGPWVVSAAASRCLARLAGAGLSRRWAFYINIPIVVASAIAVLLTVPETKSSRWQDRHVGVFARRSGPDSSCLGSLRPGVAAWWTAINDFQSAHQPQYRGMSVVPSAFLSVLYPSTSAPVWELPRPAMARARQRYSTVRDSSRFGNGSPLL